MRSSMVDEALVVEIVPKQESRQVYVIAPEEVEVIEGTRATTAAVVEVKATTTQRRKYDKRQEIKLVLACLLLISLIGVGGVLLYLKLDDGPSGIGAPPSGLPSSLYVELPCYTATQQQQRNASTNDTNGLAVLSPELKVKAGAAGGQIDFPLTNGSCTYTSLRATGLGPGLEGIKSLEVALPTEYPQSYEVTFKLFRIFTRLSNEEPAGENKTNQDNESSLQLSSLVLHLCDLVQEGYNVSEKLRLGLLADELSKSGELPLTPAAIYGSSVPDYYSGLKLGGEEKASWRSPRGFRITEITAYRQAFLFRDGENTEEIRVSINTTYLAKMDGKRGGAIVNDLGLLAEAACSYLHVMLV